MLQVDPRDAVFLYVERPVAWQTFLSAYAFVPDGSPARPADRGEITRWITDRARGIDALRQRLVRVPFDLDHPYWVEDPQYSVEDHLFFHEGSGWEELRGWMALLVQQPMDRSKPLWELHVVTGVRGIPGAGREATVAVMKFHHSMADGELSTTISRALFGASPVQDSRPAALVAAPPVPARAGLFTSAVRACPRKVGELAGGLRDFRATRRRLLAEREEGVQTLPVAKRPRTVLNQPLGPDRAFDAAFLPLDELRAMKSAVGEVTVNDLVLAVVAGALRRYLDEVDTLPDESLAAAVPMSIRHRRASESRNQFHTMAVDLHTAEVDPIARVRGIHRSVLAERERLSFPAEAEAAACDVVRVIPGWVIRAALRIGYGRPTRRSESIHLVNTLVTTVRHGDADLHLCDATAVAGFGLAPLIGLGGVAHAIGSVGGSLTINVTADPLQLRDLGRYTELLGESFDDLGRAVRHAFGQADVLAVGSGGGVAQTEGLALM
ncbi:wax ester/triacylglycerol synthase domain-containing protein [Rhodococcus maanshanensis]|uniref:diacylglycerol O-acyltransferase n=1 Tax=Rhodococcus maanshanensis TaxID=183556 RepID=A0A1H7KVW7_9NOCA|nr:wax ester/triacylglycerol synthase domain-containing protein [Rhodococcus maanshanensis]SEK90882.1 acyltransferase, WS/DGAT/MGAT [Rhodococcus maanshanensis]